MLIPRLGSPPSCRAASPASSSVGMSRSTAVRRAWSLQSGMTAAGKVSCSGTNASPTTRHIKDSSSPGVRLLTSPRAIRLQSLGPM